MLISRRGRPFSAVWGSLVCCSRASRASPARSSSSIPILGAALSWADAQAAGWLLKRAGVECRRACDEKRRTRADLRRRHHRRAAARGAAAFAELRAGRLRRHQPDAVGAVRRGLKVYRPERMAGSCSSFEVEEVLLAMPKARRRERQAALRQLEHVEGGRAHAAGHRGPCGGPRHRQRPAPRGGRRPARARPGAARHRAAGAQHRGQVGAW